MKDKLTDKQVKNAKEGKLSDGGGLYLVIPKTGSRWWRFDYRFEGKQQTISFGVYGAEADGGVTLVAARDKASAARRLVREGKRPSGTRGQNFFATDEVRATAPGGGDGPRPFDVVADAWLKTRRPPGTDHLDEVERRALSRTYDRDVRMVGYLRDGKRTAKGFGAMPFNEITRKGILPLLSACNHPTRTKLLATARKIVAYAKVHEDWPADRASPFDDDLSIGFAKHTEEHRAAIIDPVPFGQLLRKISAFEGQADGLTKYALELLALTFVRAGTMTSAKWADFDLKRAVWSIPFETLKMAHLREKTGDAENFLVPLSRQAVALLRELHTITGAEVHLFPGRSGRPMGRNTLNNALLGLGYKGVHCAHGFRSTASTLLNKERTKDGRRRFERSLVEMQLDHQDASVRPIYDRDDQMPERRELMQHWSDMVDQMRAAGNVVPMKGRAA